MRILNDDENASISRVTLYLTFAEASEMRDSIDALLSSPLGRHEHVPSGDYAKEVTVCIYDPTALEGFNDRSRMLIENNK